MSLRSLIVGLSFVSVFASSAFAAQRVVATVPTQAPATVSTLQAEPSFHNDKNVLAFNFVTLSRGNPNIYFDIGGMSDLISPSLSYRSMSSVEARKSVQNEKITVERSIATLGASVKALQQGNKSLLLSPYLFFGTERDALSTSSLSGLGLRLIGQVQLNRTVAFQAGFDANNMDSAFRGDIYLGLGFSI